MYIEEWKESMQKLLDVRNDLKPERMFRNFLSDISYMATAKDNASVMMFKDIKADFTKSLKNEELRIFSYPGDIIDSREDIDLTEEIPNCMPFKTVLVVPDKPVFLPFYKDVSNIIDSLDVVDTFIMPYIAFYEINPTKYVAMMHIIFFDFVHTKSARYLFCVNLSLESSNKISRDSVIVTLPTQIKEEYDILASAVIDITIYAFYKFNKVLYEATRDSFYSLNVKNSGKMTFENYTKRKIGQKIYSNEVLYIGKKSKIPHKLFNNMGIRHKQNIAYEVMGHWRKLIDESWVGHDRNGNPIKDYTWVKPHVRGDGDLKIKARIIKEMNE